MDDATHMLSALGKGALTLGSFLSDCPANMPCLGGPVLTWQSDGSVVLCPRIQAKYVVTACGVYLRSRTALHTVQDT